MTIEATTHTEIQEATDAAIAAIEQQLSRLRVFRDAGYPAERLGGTVSAIERIELALTDLKRIGETVDAALDDEIVDLYEAARILAERNNRSEAEMQEYVRQLRRYGTIHALNEDRKNRRQYLFRRGDIAAVRLRPYHKKSDEAGKK